MAARSVVSFDEGYHSGIHEGVRWSLAALLKIRDALPDDGADFTIARAALAEAATKLAADYETVRSAPGQRQRSDSNG